MSNRASSSASNASTAASPAAAPEDERFRELEESNQAWDKRIRESLREAEEALASRRRSS